MRVIKYIAILVSLTLLNYKGIGQITTTIDQQGTVPTCYSSFTDSEVNAGNYGANENYTITMCSDGTAGTNVVNFFFTSFDVDASDLLTVYDGNSIGAPLIGSFNNSTLIPGNIITSSTANSSGCLTFVFESDGTIEGTGWTALDSCIFICQPIDAIITTTPNATVYASDSVYTNVCFGDEIQFSTTGTYSDQSANPFSYSQNDGSTTFEWFYGDGVTAAGTNTAYTYSQQNGFLVWLKVTDAMGCVEYEKHKVRMGITPVYTDISILEDTICFAEENILFGGFNSSTSTVIGANSSSGQINAGGIVADTVWLPDGSGISYNSSIEIIGFPGQTITNASDILDICMTIEHSYIGDLNMTLTCPDGTSIFLMDEYGGGSGSGGTFLGDALDNTTPNAYGIGFEYCFDETASFGTMIAENAAGNFIPSTITPGNNILAPGSYLPEGGYASLIGCPIDGTWTVTITDNIGADDGYIYSWGLNLNPAINPDSETYTIGLTNGEWLPDPSITNTQQDSVTVVPTTSGTVSYTFEITDEFGCVFDSTLSFEVLPEIVMNAGNDTTICIGQSVQLNGSQNNVIPVPPCLFTLDLTDSFGDGWDGASLDVSINGVNTNYTFNSGYDASFTFTLNDGDLLNFTYNSGSFESEHEYLLTDCNGNTVFSDGPSPSTGIVFNYTYDGISAQYEYLWTPATSLSNNSILDPISASSSTITYTLSAFPVGFPQCVSETDNITITVDTITIPYIIGDTTLCMGSGITLSVVDGLNYLWPDNTVNSTIFINPPSDTTIIVNVGTTCMPYTLTHNIIVYPTPQPISSPDTTIISEETVELWSSGGDFYQWTEELTLDCNSCDTVIASPIDDITYYITVTDTNGCSEIDTINVTVVIPPIFIPNGFSPNNDLINDVLYVRALGVSSMQFQIFDKWGSLVFETFEVEIGWDGTFNGKALNTGVFVYKMDAQLNDGQVVSLSGNITLFK